MSRIVIFNPSTNDIIEYIPSANTPDYDKRSDVLVNPDVSLISSVPLKYIKHKTGALVEKTQAEKDTTDAQIAAKKKQDEIDRISALGVTPLEVVKGLVRLNIIPDEAAFILEIKKYRNLDK